MLILSTAENLSNASVPGIKMAQAIAARFDEAMFCFFEVKVVNGKVKKQPLQRDGKLGVGADTPPTQLVSATEVREGSVPTHGQFWGVVMYEPIADLAGNVLTVFDLDGKNCPKGEEFAPGLVALKGEAQIAGWLLEESHSRKGAHIMVAAPLDAGLPRKVNVGTGQDIEIFGQPGSDKKSVMLTDYKLFGELPDYVSVRELFADLGISLEAAPSPAATPTAAPTDGPMSETKIVNTLALANLGKWVPVLWPDAQDKGKSGWRVTSAALGRDLEEDLSFHRDGIKDFGVYDLDDPRQGKRTAIDVVSEWVTGGDWRAAADKLRELLGLPAHAERTAAADDFDDVTDKSNKTFSLDDFALNGESSDMQNKMLDDVFIVGRLAILGQATVFYASPNTGKTLLTMWLLIEAIGSGELKAEDVFYINADDTHKGLVNKLVLAEKHGFKMLSPGHKGFSADKLLGYMAKLVKQGDASGKVIILDTLKKFTDIMDKKISTGFGKAMREFVSNGGSVIMLAHVNKHKSAEGKVIHSGTSDISDDVDCAYTLDKVKDDNDTHTVIFENFKNRGDVAANATYSYTRKEGQSYPDLLATVQSLSDADMNRAKKLKEVQTKLDENASVIWAILDALNDGVSLKTEILDAARKGCGESLKRVAKVLDAHTGTDYPGGDRWRLEPSGKNAKQYFALPAA
jgi:hypothetical protein